MTVEEARELEEHTLLNCSWGTHPCCYVKLDSMPDNFWELDMAEQRRLMFEAVNWTVVKSDDFVPDDNGDYTAVIVDYWAYPEHNNIN